MPPKSTDQCDLTPQMVDAARGVLLASGFLTDGIEASSRMSPPEFDPVRDLVREAWSAARSTRPD
jgi:hypothetical protein